MKCSTSKTSATAVSLTDSRSTTSASNSCIIEANRAELEEAGEGIYAVVPPKSDLFCVGAALARSSVCVTATVSPNPLTRHGKPATPPG